MRTKLRLWVAGMLCCSIAMAGPIDVKTAARKAVKVLGKEVKDTESTTAEARARVGAETTAPAFYVFNAEDGQGFVIISGDDQMPEVVAYSHTGQFNATNMHPGLVEMLDYYTEVVNDVRQGEATVEQTTVRRAGAKAVAGPLCAAEWGQGRPYNTLCPQKDGEDCPVGCVATALAQIMYHFAWPEVGTGSFRYASGISGVGVLSSNFSEHYYAWNAMRPTTEENDASEEAAAAVAQLSYDCSVATRMEFDPDGSGTNDDLAMAALYTYFGYKASMLDLQRRDCYATQAEWNDLVKAEIDANRPVLYGGFTPSFSGHEFIIDGYDEQDNFHVNWGWDGSSNGYYSIITLAPSRTGYSFTEGQTMVCGIEPDEKGTDKTPQQWRVYMEEAPEVSVEKTELGKGVTVTLNNFYNYTRKANTWTIGVALYDLNGNQLKVLTSTSTKGNNTQQMLSYRGFSTYGITATLPRELDDGNYTLRVVFRQKDYKDFVLPDVVGGSERNNIYVQVKNGVMHFNTGVANGVEEVKSTENVISHQYFDLSGRPVQNVKKGIVIDRQTYSNGKQIVKKVRF